MIPPNKKNRIAFAGLAHKLNSIRSDVRGIAATEFALILPMLLILFVGATQLILGIQINRDVAMTANTVATIVAQYTSISKTTQLPDILAASAQIFSPNSTNPAKLMVSLVAIDSKGKATISWSQPAGTTRKVGDVITVPAAFDTPNTNLVFSEVSYAYTPAIQFVPLGTINLYAPIYMPPRASSTINLLN
jgi:Flp pilus assembly protein TadG